LVVSGISAKNWEVWQVMPYMVDGDWLDMGSDGGVVLDNLIAKGIKGAKAGIDLSYPENIRSAHHDGVILYKGDLMASTFFENSTFDFVTCLSVIEHEVDFSKFAKEVSRLLKSGGHLFVSFDYWNPKPLYEKRKLYKLDWNILDEKDVLNLIDVLRENGLHLVGDIDWTLQDAVINDRYCSPVQGVEYTFGIFHFTKI
jgi:SAM-dependent methyltransferase